MKKSENRFRSFISLMWFMGLAVMLLAAGCGGDGGSGTQPGVLSVSLTDAPACGYDEVNVTVRKVRVHQSDNANEHGGGWSEITLDPPRKINLLDLNDPTQPNFALEHLGETSLAAGHYTQLRLVLVPNNGGQPMANSVVLSGTTSEIALVTPSAVQSGIKLIHQFNVGSGQRVDLLLDFDACHSIVKRGDGAYLLKPVIKVIPFELNGIEGFIEKSEFVNESNVNHLMVSAQVNGDIVRATVPNSVTGKFFLAHLVPGNYDVVITGDGRATSVIAGVPVANTTSRTIISTEPNPFTLETSATQTIGGTVTLNPATDEAVVFVAAKQTLGSGPTVTVKAQSATTLVTTPEPGDYEYGLTLPIGAPLLGQYSTPLPIAVAAQPSAADTYTVQASAAGYVTQSAPDIPTGSVQNFSLNAVP
jgi:hypothetical protein